MPAGSPRWLTISAGLSVVLLVVMIAGARGLELPRHYWNVGGGVRIAFEDAGLSIYTPGEYGGPYRGRSLHSPPGDDRVSGFGWPFYYRHVRWSPGQEQWMVTIDLPVLLFLASILPLVWCGWQVKTAWRSTGTTRSRFRFSIRTVLLLFFALGALLSLRQYSRAQSKLAEHWEARGARLDWDCTDTPQSSVIWLIFGDNQYDDVNGVSFERDSISAVDVDSLQTYPHLIWLTFTDCTISDEAMQRIANLSRLRALRIVRSTVSPQRIEACAQLPRLTSLTLNEIDVSAVDLSKFTSIEQLEVRTPTLRDSQLTQIARISALTSLTIENADMTDAGLAELSQLESLYSLTIHDSPITGTGLQAFAHHEKVLFLYLDGCNIDSAGCEAIGRIPALREVSLQRTSATKGDIVKLSTRCRVAFP